MYLLLKESCVNVGELHDIRYTDNPKELSGIRIISELNIGYFIPLDSKWQYICRVSIPSESKCKPYGHALLANRIIVEEVMPMANYLRCLTNEELTHMLHKTAPQAIRDQCEFVHACDAEIYDASIKFSDNGRYIEKQYDFQSTVEYRN